MFFTTICRAIDGQNTRPAICCRRRVLKLVAFHQSVTGGPSENIQWNAPDVKMPKTGNRERETVKSKGAERSEHTAGLGPVVGGEQLTIQG